MGSHRNVAFWDGLLPLSIVFPTEAHPCCSWCRCFVPSRSRVTFHHVGGPMEGHLSGFQLWNSAAVNTRVQGFLGTFVFTSHGPVPWGGMARSDGDPRLREGPSGSAAGEVHLLWKVCVGLRPASLHMMGPMTVAARSPPSPGMDPTVPVASRAGAGVLLTPLPGSTPTQWHGVG